MNLFKKIKQRPLIAITILYISCLIALNYAGFFSPRRNSKALPFASYQDVKISGRIVSEPETKNEFSSFFLKTKEIDGKEISEKVLVRSYAQGPKLSIGDILDISGSIGPIPGARNPGAFDYAGFLNRQDVYALIRASRVKVASHIEPNPVYRFTKTLRKDIIKTFQTCLPPEEAALLIPRVIGDKSFMAKDAKEEFTNAGVMHILVVSGINVAYVAALFLWLFRLCGLGKRKAALLTIPFIILYAILTGANPPIVRASIMAIFIIFSLSLEREPLIYQSLALSALIILIFEPQALFTASFQFSFAATIGIVYLYRYFMIPFSGLPFWLKQSAGMVCAVSLSAQIAIMPLFAYYFNKISIVGLITNMFVVPIGGIVTASGILLYLVHFTGSFLTAILAAFNYFCVHLIILIVSYSSKMPNAIIHVQNPSLIFILSYYVILLTIFKARNNPKMWLLPLIALAAITAETAMASAHRKQTLEITFLDIPYSNSVHIRFPNGKSYLVNPGISAGNHFDSSESVLNPYLWSRGVRRVEKVFVGKNDAAHLAGVRNLIDNFHARKIILSPRNDYSDVMLAEIGSLKAKGAKIAEGRSGESFYEGGSTLTIVAPSLVSARKEDNSLVIRIAYRGRSVLLTNQAGFGAEKALISSNRCIRANVLQLPKYLLKEFLDAVDPEIAVSYFPPIGKINRKTYSIADSGAVSAILGPGRIIVEEFKKRKY